MFLLLLFVTTFIFWSMWCAFEKKPHWWLLSLFLYLVITLGFQFITGHNFWGIEQY